MVARIFTPFWDHFQAYWSLPLSLFVAAAIMYLVYRSMVQEIKKIALPPVLYKHKYFSEQMGEQFVETVIKGSARTSSIMYVMALLVILIVAVIRSTVSPTWNDARVALVMIAEPCSKDLRFDKDCRKALDYTAHLGFDFERHPEISTDPGNRIGKAYDKQVEALLQTRTTLHTMIQLPIFGVPIDGNDLWMVSGMALAVMLYLLRLSLAREYYNIIRLLSHCRRPETIELVIMGQLLSAPPNAVRLSKGVPFLVFCLPATLHSYVVLTDLWTLHINRLLSSTYFVGLNAVFEVLSVVVVAYLAGKCYGISLATMNLLDLARKNIAPTIASMEKF